MRLTALLIFLSILAFGQSPLQRVMMSQGEETSNTGYVDYKTNMVEEWVMNRGIVIRATNDYVEYIQGRNGNHRLLTSGNLLTTNNEIQLTTLGDGFANAFDTEITNGYGFTGDISIVFYVKKPSAHSAIQVLYDGANSNSSTNPLVQFRTQVSGANLNMEINYNAVSYVLTGQQFPYDNNYHVVVLRIRNDAGAIKGSINIDGTQRGSEQSMTGSMTDWGAKIARRYMRTSTTTWFGYVKRIRVYNEWLSDANISTYLNASNSVFKRDEVETKDEWVVACWGQSNWLGEPFSTTSELTPSDRQQQIPNTNFFGDVTTRLLNGPLLSEVRPALGPGPVIELGYQLKTKYPNKNFYVISVAASNTGMASYWNSRSSGTGWLEYSRQLTNLLIKLKAEGRTISTVAICDYQGETDASTTTDANNFETNRGNFYDDASTIITGQFASATIKIQLGRISSGLSIVSYPGRDIVRTAITNLAGARANISIINSDDLNLGWIGGDGTHYQTTQLQTIGARIATQLWVIPFFIVPFRRKKNIKLWKEYSNRLAA